MKVRIKFRKYGPLRFIGHLDVMRYFQKAMRRAGIDIAYTSGYNPHQIMSFASPLGVGLESRSEYMDVELNSLSSCEDIVARLNAAGVEGLDVVNAVILPDCAGNAMASIAAAAYTVRFRKGREPSFDYRSRIREFAERDCIPFVKTSKKGEREINLRDGIFVMEERDGGIFLLTDASSAGNIKPQTVIEAFLLDCGEKLQENALLITREEIYTRGAEDGKLIPLEAVGIQSDMMRQDLA